ATTYTRYALAGADRQIRAHRGQFAQRWYRPQQVDPAHRAREPVRTSLDELPRGDRGLAQVVHQDRLLHALLVHLVEEFGQVDRREHGLRTLEIVVANLLHPGRLHLGLTEMHIDQTVQHLSCHAILIALCTATSLAQR